MRIAFLTESRADWGGIFPVLREAAKRGHTCIVWITGDHLIQGTNCCVETDIVEIDNCGVFITEDSRKVFGWHSRYSSSSMSTGIISDDWFVLLGDRKNLLPFVAGAYQDNIGIAHMSGGDRQEGFLVDEPVRHSISKFAHIHFPILPSSADRLQRMDEDPRRIYQVGSTFIDDLVDFVPVKSQDYNQYYVVQMHPAYGWQFDLTNIQERLLLGKIKIPSTHKEYREAADKYVRILEPNTDSGYGKKPESTEYIPNMPRPVLLQFLWNARAFVGNSSALFLEAQYLGVPCIHRPPRNKCREEAFLGHITTLDRLDYLPGIIGKAKDARTETGLRADWRKGAHGNGTAAKKIIDVLEKTGEPSREFLHKDWV